MQCKKEKKKGIKNIPKRFEGVYENGKVHANGRIKKKKKKKNATRK